MTGNLASQSFDAAVKFKLRGDLVVENYAVGVRNRTVVKDPLKLQYYLFDPFEKNLLNLLGQPLSLTELKDRADQCGPDIVDMATVQRFLQRLLKDNLIIADRPGFGAALWKWRVEADRQKWIQRLFSVLAIRFPGLNPQPWLDRLNPFTKYLFHPACLSLAFFAFLVGIMAVVLNADQVMQMKHLWQHLSHPRMMVALVIGTMVVKSLHELGHALACSSIGRDCHEMGVMLLVFMPCLYCNVSDIWMESDRWKRIMVSAAGIHVEMLIAVLCVPVWLFSQHGGLQVYAFAMLTICSVNTLFINGNPLLRYDGYYVLSDWLEIPNLSQRAQLSLSHRLRWLFFKSADSPQPVGFLDIYGLASRVYRLLILGLILFAVYAVFERLELPRLGLTVSLLLAGITFGPMLAIAALRTWRGRQSSVWRAGRVATFGVGLLLFFLLLLNLPIKPRLFADGEIALQKQGIVYAPQAGRLDWLCQRGDPVLEGQLIAQVENDQLQLELIRQQQGVRELELSLANQLVLQRQGSDNSREIELQKDMLASARKIEEELRGRIDKLQIRAALSGQLAALPQPLEDRSQPLDLARISSSLLRRNRGCAIERGEPIAVITSPQTTIVKLWLGESKVSHVKEGQQVKMLVPQASPEFVYGTVRQIAIDRSDASRPSTESIAKATLPTVEVMVQLDCLEADYFFKSRVHAAIIGPPVPLYQYLWRSITHR